MTKFKGKIKEFLRMLKLSSLPGKSKLTASSTTLSIDKIKVVATSKGIKIDAMDTSHVMAVYLKFFAIEVVEKGTVFIDIERMQRYLKRFDAEDEITLDFKDKIFLDHKKSGAFGEFQNLAEFEDDTMDNMLKWVKIGTNKFPKLGSVIGVLLKFKPERFQEVLKDADVLKDYSYTFIVNKQNGDLKLTVISKDFDGNTFKRNIPAIIDVAEGTELPVVTQYSTGIWGLFNVLEKECLIYIASGLPFVSVYKTEDFDHVFCTAPIIEENEEEIEEEEEEEIAKDEELEEFEEVEEVETEEIEEDE